MKLKVRKGIGSTIAIWTIGILSIIISVALSIINILQPYVNTSIIILFWICSAFCLLTGISMLITWFTLYYEITEDSIIIHHSPFKDKNIKFNQIISITKSNTVLAGPALSLKNRIIILQKDGVSTVISPEDLSKFIMTIKKISPSIPIRL